MNSRKHLNQFLINLIIAVSCFFLSGDIAHCQARKYERHTAEFRYVIYSNQISRRFGFPPERNIGVLIEKESFTEEILKKLFSSISKRYPIPQKINGWVVVSLWQIPTPEELAIGPSSENPPDPHDDQYPSAILWRDSKNTYIRYSFEGPPYWKEKTIVIKGSDPYKRK